MIPFVYFWNNFLDREFAIPEDIIHFDKHIQLKEKPWNLGHCYGNSFALKYGFGNTRKFGYKAMKPHPELELCVGLAIKKLFFDAINEGFHLEWKNAIKEKFKLKREIVEPTPLVHFHGWNLIKGKVFDLTYGENHRDYEYIGWVIPDSIGKTFKDAPDVRRYLDFLMGFDNDTRFAMREGRAPKRTKEVEYA